MGLNWQDAREIGELLLENYDTLDPRTVRLPDLRNWVLNLEDFAGKPDEADDRALEAIRQAWYLEWKDEFGDE
jgi:FeS assembly protein IscX